ncbi:MAG: ribose 5-phosphate isomerase B [Desulfovibrio sp.]|jgi:ribose 5-phosphate isomerase B|nr:ribose 5-phosphate isomerase B [Desulfovibrio sp.]
MPCLHIASDHAGFALKTALGRRLADLGHDIVDDGTYSDESCDYPVFAHKLCAAVEDSDCLGILICGTGTGMSMAANRHPGIRAALCATELHARLARNHNDANVLCLGARITGVELAFAIVESFLAARFEGGRHQQRLDLLKG